MTEFFFEKSKYRNKIFNKKKIKGHTI